MKDKHNTQTQDLIPAKRGRGRPSTGKALTPAQKQAAYRARQHHKNITVTINRDDVVTMCQAIAFAEYWALEHGMYIDLESVQRLKAAIEDARRAKGEAL